MSLTPEQIEVERYRMFIKKLRQTFANWGPAFDSLRDECDAILAPPKGAAK